MKNKSVKRFKTRSIHTYVKQVSWVKRELNELTERFVDRFGHHKDGTASKNGAWQIIWEIIHIKVINLLDKEEE